jgi:Na+-translocating ferredoxin:NAD+ oxidoreductase RNF subunit RnfB
VSYSRRGLFSFLARPLKAAASSGKSVANIAIGRSAGAPNPPQEDRVAIIQGIHCLAVTNGCSICIQQCLVEGALVFRDGMPMVVPDICTGCRVCFEVCPAPTNAVLMMKRTNSSNP